MLNSGVRSYPNTTIVVAGGLSNGMTYILDGGTHNDPMNNLNLPLPFPDAMQEFKVETSALPAQYGHHSAAAVNAVTKSGTNTLHGSAFEFMRDDSLNATNAFAAVGPDGKRRSDGLRRDQFGGTLGGPIVQGKLFYFGGYQATRVNVTPTSFFQFVPTPAMLAGDFTAFTSPACNAGRTIALRAPFVNNTVSPSQFSAGRAEPRGAAAEADQRLRPDRSSIARRRAPSTCAMGASTSSGATAIRCSAATSWRSTTRSRTTIPNNVLAYANGPIDDTVHSFVIGDTLLAGVEHGELVPRHLQQLGHPQGLRAVLRLRDLGIRNVAVPRAGFMAFTVSAGSRWVRPARSRAPCRPRPFSSSTT